MGFFRRKFAEWSQRAWKDANSVNLVEAMPARCEVDADPQMNFKIFGATGGYVLEFRRYDKRTENYNGNLYVIPKEEDVGERVARIVNMEMMK